MIYTLLIDLSHLLYSALYALKGLNAMSGNITIDASTTDQVQPIVLLYQLLESCARRFADSVAVVQGDEQITYQELKRRSDQIAAFLQMQGVGPEVVVGLYMERSIAMIIAFLGILKAGGVYFPIDISYPETRTQMLLQDTQAAFLITQASLSSRLHFYAGQLLISENLHDPILQNLCYKTRINQDSLAYIIYTSGSTGRPKGTMISHKGLVNLALAQARAFHVGSETRILQFASLSFDASISEMLLALTMGATLCLVSREDMLLSSALATYMEHQAITIATFPPSLLSMLNEARFSAPETVVVAGEACTREIIQRWGQHHTVLNAYGPTENTVCATIALCSAEQNQVTIGRAIDNVEVYILDESLQQARDGSIGEIYLGGIGVARGYLHQAALTAERFIPHPFSSQPGARLYKTGDRARFLSHGDIEYIGRFDRQVKIRGIRIELGEIESALTRFSGVQCAVVIASDHVINVRQLIAYVIPEEGFRITVTEIRQWLMHQLPEYMLPSNILLIPSLPLTLQGKVNRRALLTLAQGSTYLPEDMIYATTPTEKRIAVICEEILIHPLISIHTNLYEVGMHSLSAMQIIEKINQTFRIRFSIAQIFETSTIASLDHVVDATISH